MADRTRILRATLLAAPLGALALLAQAQTQDSDVPTSPHQEEVLRGQQSGEQQGDQQPSTGQPQTGAQDVPTSPTRSRCCAASRANSPRRSNRKPGRRKATCRPRRTRNRCCVASSRATRSNRGPGRRKATCRPRRTRSRCCPAGRADSAGIQEDHPAPGDWTGQGPAGPPAGPVVYSMTSSSIVRGRLLDHRLAAAAQDRVALVQRALVDRAAGSSQSSSRIWPLWP